MTGDDVDTAELRRLREALTDLLASAREARLCEGLQMWWGAGEDASDRMIALDTALDAARAALAATPEPGEPGGEVARPGRVEFAWLVDGVAAFPWTEGQEPRLVKAKYDPKLVRREIGPWRYSDDPRFTPTPEPGA